MDLQNSRNSNTVPISNLYVTEGHKRIEIPEIRTGDIGAVVKLKDGEVNDTYMKRT